MKKAITLSVFLLIVFFTYQTIAQQMGAIRKAAQVNIPEKIYKPLGPPLAAGTYTIGSGGHFPTIDSAFNKLSTDGIAGTVTLELIDTLYTAPTDAFGFLLNGPIPGTGPTARVTIKPADNTNVVIEGSGGAAMSLLNASFVTIDGVALTGTTTLWFHTYNNAPYYNDGLDFRNNSDHNIIQNITCISENFLNSTGICLWSTETTTPDSNLIQNNFIKKGAIGIILLPLDYQHRCTGNIIKQNIVGSATDSLIGWGIVPVYSSKTIIEGNIVSHLTLSVPNISYRYMTYGISVLMSTETIIRNNLIYNVQTSSGMEASGISLFGDYVSTGNSNMVYNNIINNIQSSSTNLDSKIAGIYIVGQVQPRIYYNTVYLYGQGANHQGSAALYIMEGCTGVSVKNNIFVNTRDESQYCASSVYNYTTSNLTSDYNDLFYETNQYNCLVKVGGTNYNTLADWQITGSDLNSTAEIPNFIDPDLHINPIIPTGIESHAIPIAGIVTDFDGDLRSTTTPDIGADEFAGIVDVEDETALPTEFSLEQNYPNPFNPTTTVSWQSPVGSRQTLTVYDILGREIATLLDEYKSAGKYEIEFSAKDLPSGIYFYQIKAGEFIAVKKMILLK